MDSQRARSPRGTARGRQRCPQCTDYARPTAPGARGKRRMKAILTYHSIDDSGSVISVDAATFRAHIEWLVKQKIAVVPLDRLREMSDDTHAVALTFDDGFENFATGAWPVLRDYALPVTV